MNEPYVWYNVLVNQWICILSAGSWSTYREIWLCSITRPTDRQIRKAVKDSKEALC